MSYHYEWGTAVGGLYLITTAGDALDDLGDELEHGPLALFIGNESGDGTVLEGDAEGIRQFARSLHEYVERVLA